MHFPRFLSRYLSQQSSASRRSGEFLPHLGEHERELEGRGQELEERAQDLGAHALAPGGQRELASSIQWLRLRTLSCLLGLVFRTLRALCIYGPGSTQWFCVKSLPSPSSESGHHCGLLLLNYIDRAIALILPLGHQEAAR